MNRGLEDKIKSSRIIKEYRVVGDVLWTVQSHSGGSFITSYLLSECKNDTLAGGRSEGRIPHDTSCPIEFLNMVRVVNPDWREKVNPKPVRRRRVV